MNNLLSGISALLIYNICAASLVSISIFYFYKMVGVIDFSFALSITMSPYFAYFALSQLKTSLFLSCLIGLVVSSLVVAPLLFSIVYGVKQSKDSGQLGCMIVSLGLYTIGVNLISILTDDLVSAFPYNQISTAMPLFGLTLTLGQMLIIVGAVICVILLYIIRYTTKLGILVKAVSNNIPLSAMIGLPVGSVKFLTFICGMFVLGFFGISFSFDHGMIPTMGLSPFLTGMVVVIVSHKYEINYMMIVLICLSIIQFLVTWLIGSQWMDAVSFTVLLSYILLMRRRSAYVG